MRIIVLVVLLLLAASEANAQRNCKKGIPCGGSCISAAKTCRVGTQPADTASAASVRPRPLSPDDQGAIVRRLTGDTTAKAATDFGPFVGSVDGDVYYAVGCNTSWKLTAEERVYFRNEQEALAKGYHRSRAKNC
jgi:deoxyribonuclease-1